MFAPGCQLAVRRTPSSTCSNLVSKFINPFYITRRVFWSVVVNLKIIYVFLDLLGRYWKIMLLRSAFLSVITSGCATTRLQTCQATTAWNSKTLSCVVRSSGKEAQRSVAAPFYWFLWWMWRHVKTMKNSLWKLPVSLMILMQDCYGLAGCLTFELIWASSAAQVLG